MQSTAKTKRLVWTKSEPVNTKYLLNHRLNRGFGLESETALNSATKNTKGTVFSQKDYDSGNGMLTDIWGACQWHVLHTMSFNYPIQPTAEQKRCYRAHIRNLVNVLPCGKCRKNLVRNLGKLPLETKHMQSRATFSRYVYNLHEAVNTMLHKTSGLSYEQVRDRYEQFRSRCTLTPDEPEVHSNRKPESGCTEPLVGEKQKCVLNIVPKTKKCTIFNIDRKCIKTRRVTK
jgi:hypothetical protein